MSNGQDRLEKVQALYEQFQAHAVKFQDGCEADDFYKAKKALGDMITFHNEIAKIRDRYERKGARDVVESLDGMLDNTRSILSHDRLSHYELSHREVK